MQKNKVKVWTASFIEIVIAFTLVKSVNRMLDTFLPVYVDGLGGSAIIIGLMPTAFSVANIILRPFAGVFIDKKGRYFTLLLGVALILFSTIGNMFVPSVLFLLFTRALHGFGNAFSGTTLSTMASDVLPESRMTDGLGYLNLGATLSSAVAPMIMLTIYEHTNEKPCLLILVCCAVAALAFSLTLKKCCKNIEDKRKIEFAEEVEKAKNARMTPWVVVKNMFTNDSWKPSTLIIFTTMADSAASTFIALFAVERGIENYSLYFTLQSAAVALARFTVGKVSRKIGIHKMLYLSILIDGLCIYAISACHSLVPLLICGVIIGYVQGAINPQINSLAVLAAPKSQRGMANATYYLFVDLAGSIGGLFAGIVVELFGRTSAFIYGGSVAVLTAAAVFAFRSFFVPKKAEEILTSENA